jgi:hypothetical protein
MELYHIGTVLRQHLNQIFSRHWIIIKPVSNNPGIFLDSHVHSKMYLFNIFMHQSTTFIVINAIGNRLIAESGDSKSKKFLFERISLAIQRGNAASIRGTFPDSALLSEIFVL